MRDKKKRSKQNASDMSKDEDYALPPGKKSRRQKEQSMLTKIRRNRPYKFEDDE